MRIFKAVILVLAMPIALFASAVAWAFLQVQVLYPLQYARLRTQAEAWNRENWETGSALRVTVQVSSGEALGRKSATATVNCYQKMFARAGGLKGRPGSPVVIKSDGPGYLILPFGPNAMHSTPLRDVCRDAFRKHEEWQLPHVTESHYYWSNIVANDQSFRCFLGNDPRTTRGKITRPTFLDVQQLPLHEVLSVDEYDALPYRDEHPYTRPPPTYYWWTEEVDTKCWRAHIRDNCTSDVEKICGTPFS